MDSSRLAELLAPFVVLSPAQLASVSTYLDLLLKWNQTINLTAIRDPEDVVARHFGESFFAASHLARLDARTTFDLGSGAGFPGLPLAILLPQLRVGLIESNARKATFLKEAIRAMQLDNAEVHHARAEDLVASGARADLVTLRAVESFEGALATAAALLQPAARGIPPSHLALLISSNQSAAAASALPAFQWDAPIPLPLSRARILLTGSPASASH